MTRLLVCAVALGLLSPSTRAQFIVPRATSAAAASDYYTGTTRTAASCSRADVLTAYNLTADQGILAIPTGDCDASNQWGSYITISKKIMIKGNGAANTIIGISAPESGFSIQTDSVRITAIQFDCNFQSTTLTGPVQAGGTSGDPAWDYEDIRVDHNTFRNCGTNSDPSGTTGNDAISFNGKIGATVDHNTFNDCNGECIDICSDGVLGIGRSVAYGGSGAGWVFIEDNTFNATQGSFLYENIVDGNSGYRVVFRYNTINFSNGATYGSDIISGHETCATCSGLSAGQGDAGSLVTEIYGNTANLGATGVMEGWNSCRGGRCLVYNNNITFSGSSVGRWAVGMTISNYRSNEYTAPGHCGAASNARGYADYCHEVDGVLNVEGLTAALTTLNTTINSSTTTVILNSTAGMNTDGDTNGFAVRIGLETICYSGISGSTLTGVTRGCTASTTNGTPSQVGAAHTAGASVDYLKFGLCLEQPNNSYLYSNTVAGSADTPSNTVGVCSTSNPRCDGFTGPDYTALDIRSFAVRPSNWQYKEGPLTYTAYTYPHPLTTTTGPG